MSLQEIFERRRNYRQGTKVVNCVTHAHLLLTKRPPSCELCHTDIMNVLTNSSNVNDFLNELMDEIEAVFEPNQEFREWLARRYPEIELSPAQEAVVSLFLQILKGGGKTFLLDRLVEHDR